MYQQDKKLRQQQFLTGFLTNALDHGLSQDFHFAIKGLKN